jgi:hypothetical protein
MRRPVFLIFVNAMILLVVFALLTQSLLIVQRLAQAQAVAGHVEVQRGGRGNFRALAQGDFVKTGDVVRTGTASASEFRWADGTRWKVLPNSVLTVKKATSNTAERADHSHLHLAEGKVLVRITRALERGSRFEVETPTATADVRGTIFSIESTGGASGQTRVRVWKGEVSLAGRSGRHTTVATGQTARVEGGEVSATADPDNSREFEAHPTIARPMLSAFVSALEASPSGAAMALVSGTSEVGSDVLVNGELARVRFNGAFRLKVRVPQDRAFHVVVRDRHGATTQWHGSL